jgi:hypothetical protein
MASGDFLAAGVLHDNTLGKGYGVVIADELQKESYSVEFNISFALPGYSSEQVFTDTQSVTKDIRVSKNHDFVTLFVVNKDSYIDYMESISTLFIN